MGADSLGIKAITQIILDEIQMLLDHLREERAAGKLEQAIQRIVARDIKSLAAGKMGCSTSEVGDLVVQYVWGGK